MGDLLSNGYEENVTESYTEKIVLPENHHPHSRFKMVERPFGYLPGDLIHNTLDGPVFDLGIDLDDRMGYAFIRISDIEDMARVLGMATKEEVAGYKTTIAGLQQQVQRLPQEVGKLQNGLDDLLNGFSESISTFDPATDSLLDSLEDDSEELESDGDGKSAANVEPDKAKSTNTGQSPKPSKRKGPADVPANSGNESGDLSTGGKPGENDFGDNLDLDFGFSGPVG